jgi:hypothetical protein
MSEGEIGYLSLVLVAFFTFICSVAFLSIWSRRGKRQDPALSPPLSDALAHVQHAGLNMKRDTAQPISGSDPALQRSRSEGRAA